MKNIRISVGGELQRLVVPNDAVVEIVKDSFAQYYNGHTTEGYAYSIEIKQGGFVLAKIMNVQSFRDETVQIQKIKVVNGEATWVEAE